MTVNELKEVLETIINNRDGDLPLAFFANNHTCMSDEVNGRTTINLCEVGRIDMPTGHEYQKKFVLVGNYWDSKEQFKVICKY